MEKRTRATALPRVVMVCAVLLVGFHATMAMAHSRRRTIGRRIALPILSTTPQPEKGKLTKVEYFVKASSLSIYPSVERERPYLGVVVSERRQEPFVGVVVDRVVSDTTAAEIGLRRGDIILKLGKEKLLSRHHFKSVLGKLSLTEPVPMTVLRNDQPIEFSVELAATKAIEKPVVSFSLEHVADRRHTSATFAALRGDAAAYFFEDAKQQAILLTRISEGGPLFYSDLRPGDVILRADSQEVTDPQQLVVMFGQAARNGKDVQLRVMRGFATFTQSVSPVTDAYSGFSFNIPIVIDWSKSQARTEFELVWGLVFDYSWQAYYSNGEPTTSRGWSLPLSLIEYRNTGGKKTFSLLWLIDIDW